MSVAASSGPRDSAAVVARVRWRTAELRVSSAVKVGTRSVGQCPTGSDAWPSLASLGRGAPPSSPAPAAPRSAAKGLDRGARPRGGHRCHRRRICPTPPVVVATKPGTVRQVQSSLLHISRLRHTRQPYRDAVVNKTGERSGGRTLSLPSRGRRGTAEMFDAAAKARLPPPQRPLGQ